ncbi:MAG: non-ribosomal peptide synthetase [Bacteroidota bacterium]
MKNHLKNPLDLFSQWKPYLPESPTGLYFGDADLKSTGSLEVIRVPISDLSWSILEKAGEGVKQFTLFSTLASYCLHQYSLLPVQVQVPGLSTGLKTQRTYAVDLSLPTEGTMKEALNRTLSQLKGVYVSEGKPAAEHSNVLVESTALHQFTNREVFNLVLSLEPATREICIYFRPLEGAQAYFRQLANRLTMLLGRVNTFDITVGALLSSEQKDLPSNPKSPIPEKDYLRPLIAGFEAHAQSHPTDEAILWEGTTLTYAEVDQKANQLAHHLLQTCTIAPDTIISVFTNRGPESIIAILAILKTGAAYLPIDPSTPQNRVAIMLEDSKSLAVLTVMDLFGELSHFGGYIFALDLQLKGLDTPVTRPDIQIQPDHLAYLIFTSGSTGRPKAVQIEHRNIVHTLCSQYQEYVAGQKNRYLQFSSLAFDASVLEIFYPLSYGYTLVAIPEESILSLQKFDAYVAQHEVSHYILPPSYVSQLQSLPPFTQLLTAGEAANPRDVLRFQDQGQYFNGYGPSETAICCALYAVPQQAALKTRVPIGTPTHGTTMYVVDEGGNLLPPNTPGELAIGGPSVGRGYLNRPELTAAKFRPNPFTGEGTLYFTGDLGMMNDEGEFYFLRRKDQQVKVNGFRIELEEIEYQLAKHPDVSQCAVIVYEHQHQKQLMGYYVTQANAALAPADLKTYLRDHFADYMIPGRWKSLDSLPTNTSGKIDRQALVQMSQYRPTEEKLVAPSNDLESQLLSIWKDVLQLESIGIRDNFFELGGNSLKVVDLFSRLQTQWPNRLELSELFVYDTIEVLAQQIDPDFKKAPTAQFKKVEI